MDLDRSTVAWPCHQRTPDADTSLESTRGSGSGARLILAPAHEPRRPTARVLRLPRNIGRGSVEQAAPLRARTETGRRTCSAAPTGPRLVQLAANALLEREPAVPGASTVSRMHRLMVLYPPPTDPDHFRTYYEETHLKLVAKWPGLRGYRRAQLRTPRRLSHRSAQPASRQSVRCARPAVVRQPLGGALPRERRRSIRTNPLPRECRRSIRTNPDRPATARPDAVERDRRTRLPASSLRLRGPSHLRAADCPFRLGGGSGAARNQPPADACRRSVATSGAGASRSPS